MRIRGERKTDRESERETEVRQGGKERESARATDACMQTLESAMDVCMQTLEQNGRVKFFMEVYSRLFFFFSISFFGGGAGI